mgnify:CR=1 FL=1
MVYILLGEGFEEAEALVTADVLRRADIPVTLTGIGRDTVTGSHNITVRTDKPVNLVKLQPDDMVVLPGGMGGVAAMEGSGEAMALIRQAAAGGDYWLAAICAAPTLLGRWGHLSGKEAVCYPGMEGQLAGAQARPDVACGVVTDGRIITGRAAGSAFDFGLALVEALKGKGAAEQVRNAIRY